MLKVVSTVLLSAMLVTGIAAVPSYAKPAKASKAAKAATCYQCPMCHAKSAKAGKCPKCKVAMAKCDMMNMKHDASGHDHKAPEKK